MASLLDELFNNINSGQGAQPVVQPQELQQGDVPAAPLVQAEGGDQPRGRHGVMGVVNGILETLGDIALVQSGLQPYFGPAHQQRRLSEALTNLQDDPQGTIAKVAQIDPDRAVKMQDDWIKTNLSLRGAARQEALADQQIRNEQGKSYAVLGAMAGSMTPENYSQMLPILQRYAAKNGVELPPAPDSYDANYAASIRTMGIPGYQQERLADYDTAEQNDEAYRAARLEDYDTDREARTATADANRAAADARAAAGRAAADRRADRAEAGRMARAAMPARPRAGGTNRASLPSAPPRRSGDRYRMGGNTYVSRDGKTWIKE